jgi:hypothetical protein
MTTEQAWALYNEHADHSPALIHAGFADVQGLSKKLGKPTKGHYHIFFARACGKLYQNQFKGARRVLLKDGFERKRNADYDPVERFSDLHVIFEDEGMTGFGDFLIVGDDYSESGGPAYAVAIHLTLIDPEKFDEIWIHHFVSVTQDTPKDPAGKFGEALAKMMKTLKKPNCNILETAAVKEYRTLFDEGHFPGLGYVKKLSHLYRARIQTEDMPFPIAKMGAPPSRTATHGRANPAGIPYLYLGSRPDTAISETRPHTGELVCVADFATPPDLRLVDLRHPRRVVSPFVLADATDVAQMRSDLPFLERLGDELMRPVLPQAAAIDYTPSQYLCEFIWRCSYHHAQRWAPSSSTG